MRFGYLILFLFLACIACERYEVGGVDLFHTDSWDVGFSLASGNCVVYNDTLYVLFGREEGGSAEEPSGKMRYAAMSDLSKFEEVELPIDSRVSATAIVVGDKLYAGLGFRGKAYGEGSILRDWWEYDFGTRELRRLADLPAKTAVRPVVWFDGGYIYSALGFASNFSKSVYRYDIEGDRWELHAETSEPYVRANAVGGKVGDYAYIGTGYGIEMRRDWWRYDWRRNDWEKCDDLPDKGRVFASAVVVGNGVYVLGGRYFGGTETREYFYETVICYDVDSQQWKSVGRMEQGAENMIAFEYNGDLYWGLGQCRDGSFVRRFYRRNMRIEN
ncbi:MAG: hypothetical protein J6A44_01965 [Paludibacteraceae bacterium]|nr:hypothetical protein [Paludibacteraceae bacterium]